VALALRELRPSRGAFQFQDIGDHVGGVCLQRRQAGGELVGSGKAGQRIVGGRGRRNGSFE
jgi:hypothetical protein